MSLFTNLLVVKVWISKIYYAKNSGWAEVLSMADIFQTLNLSSFLCPFIMCINIGARLNISHRGDRGPQLKCTYTERLKILPQDVLQLYEWLKIWPQNVLLYEWLKIWPQDVLQLYEWLKISPQDVLQPYKWLKISPKDVLQLYEWLKISPQDVLQLYEWLKLSPQDILQLYEWLKISASGHTETVRMTKNFRLRIYCNCTNN